MLKLKMVDMKKELEDNLISYNQHVIDTRTEFKEHAPFTCPEIEKDVDTHTAILFIEEFKKRITDNRQRAEAMKRGMEIFGIEQPEYKETDDTEKEVLMLEKVSEEIIYIYFDSIFFFFFFVDDARIYLICIFFIQYSMSFK
jgi:hypothetical protein